MCEKNGIPIDVADTICTSFLEAFRTCPAQENKDLDSWRSLLWRDALGDQYNHLTDDIYKKWLELRLKHLAPTPEVLTLLRTLRQHYFIGLITNGPSAAQWEKVDSLGLKPFFDIILVSGDWPWEKPHQKIFQEACDFLGIELNQSIMIGDKLETDILGGVTAKLGGTVWIPLASRELNENDPTPDYIIDCVTELPSLLPQIKNVPNFRNKGRNLVLVNKGISLSDMDDCNSNSSDGS